jgi:CheY-like chemotaxis protein
MGSRREPIRVAVAEDDAGLREAVASTLRDRGLEVVEATDGGTLLSALQRGGVTLVVTDLRMPVLHGSDVISLRRLSGDRTPFVVITGAPAMVAETVLGPGVTIVHKPFTDDALVRAVSSALGADLDELV